MATASLASRTAGSAAQRMALRSRAGACCARPGLYAKLQQQQQQQHQQLARIPHTHSLSTRAAPAPAAAAGSSPAAWRQASRTSLPAAGSALLLTNSRTLAARDPAVTTLLIGSSRALSLWPFSRTPKQQQAPGSDAASSAEQITQQLQEQTQQAAHEAKEAISSSAASAQQAASDLPSKATEVAHNVQEGIVNSSEAVSQLVSTVAAGGELPHTPTFTELGLGSSWWPPTGWLQTFLDYVTTTTGLPWWATIIGTTITLRFALAPILVYVQGNTIRLSNIQPKLQVIMNDIQHAKATGDTALVQASAHKAQALFRENNCHPLRSFLLPAVQMPIFISFFFALRGMATAGLPSLKDGGLGWFVDLTAADPYYILPITSAALTLAVLETGAETGTNQTMANPQMKTMKNFLRGFLVIATFFILDFPAAVLLYWCTNNSFSLLQLLALRTNFLRSRLNLPERLPQAAPKPVTLTAGTGGYRAAPTAAKEVGFWEGIKQGMDSVKGMDAHTRSKAPSALSRRTVSPAAAVAASGTAAAEDPTAASLARDRALKALYEQGGAGATGAGAAGAATTTAATASAGVPPGQVGRANAAEERAARIQSARQRRAARRRV